VKIGVAITDVCTGLFAHGAILAALHARRRTGRGQKIDVSLLETQVASLVNIASNFLISGKEPRRWGTAHER
jgi:succinate--hydroxymethylglutarate CoA-transferase